jgi:2-oxoglutarate ferredoxin oxidoreductase subunit alpha
MAADHQVQLDKRLRKLARHDYGDAWAEIRGSGGTCILTWGSSSGASFEAAQRLTGEAQPTRAIAVRLLAPLQVEALRNAIDGADHVLVVEQNHGAQFFHYLRSRGVLDDRAQSLARPGPLPIRPGEIVNFLKEWN